MQIQNLGVMAVDQLAENVMYQKTSHHRQNILLVYGFIKSYPKLESINIEKNLPSLAKSSECTQISIQSKAQKICYTKNRTDLCLIWLYGHTCFSEFKH